jgi:Ca-activated chloride channel family protein
MKFIRYSKFKGFDVFGINLGDLVDALTDNFLQSGYSDNYYRTRQHIPQDTSLDALRQALLQALLEKGILDRYQIQEMLDENRGEFKGSLLEELINRLIERLVEEGYLKLTAEEEPQQQRRDQMQTGPGQVGQPLPQNIKFEVTEKGLDFLGYKTLRKLLGSLGKSSFGRHDTQHLATGVEAAQISKQYEFGDTIDLLQKSVTDATSSSKGK